MADFCKQCSIEKLGEDFRDLANLLPEGWKDVPVICEGCGATAVNNEGECVTDCDKHHVPGDGHGT